MADRRTAEGRSRSEELPITSSRTAIKDADERRRQSTITCDGGFPRPVSVHPLEGPPWGQGLFTLIDYLTCSLIFKHILGPILLLFFVELSGPM